jgi:hypothetical protein
MQNFYLTLEEIRASKSQIESEFNTLLENKRIVPRKNKKQWQFFNHCFQLLFGTATAFACPANKTSTYAHEVNKRLNVFKNQKSEKEFDFHIIHEKNIPPALVDYPAYNGYTVMISNRAEIQERLELLETTIDQAVEREFKIYQSIPTPDLESQLSELKRLYDENGTAYRDIVKTLENRSRQEHTLQYPPKNPSNKQLREIAVVNHSKTEATVEAKVYMYLKWWSVREEKYIDRPYQDEVIITYNLTWKDDGWTVLNMHYPEKNPKKLKS